MNIALCSPSKNTYSETFIQAHKVFLKGNIHYYYHGELPTKLEGGLVINSRKSRIVDIFKGHLRLNKYSLAEQALITSFKLKKIDLVFAEYGPTGTRMLPVCKALNLPLIVHFHGVDASRNEVLENNANYSELFEYASYVIAVSKQMYSKLLKLGCPQEKLVYNVYGPRDGFFEVSPNFKKPQFISIGRFVDKKAPYYLIISFRKVLEKHPDGMLIMAGKGNLLNACKNLVSYYNLEKNIHFPGVISADEFRGYLRDSRALLQHSIKAEDGDSEGTPLAVLEASAAGLPVISTNHAGIPDVIIDGKTGFLVEEHDVDGMALKIISLIENIEQAQHMGQSGKKNIRENFTLERHITKLNELVKTTLENSGKY
ncbi:glycosyltransferase [Christiangramia crocea]|uniref:Glycosyltransferase n=1 Tax=Christiangramia crocea TaxID=2904124 RepID=A0A9X2A7F4_9FLAO|nr:glycosyltransferase [Gramella crocea]MCG9973020.1 glycosyltransferase [Gramella crocea]